ncbi:MAG TPA: hypothetical protein PKY77_06095 [Phycisphaerae bacterium]|nr:hypothetical protein [Phycisphaerae bacterium]HRY68983.1 hypothetical protein [Phycisphaerae bacterium]HSA26043.1 hypothetical protein [Phycisphaerae bacterium]
MAVTRGLIALGWFTCIMAWGLVVLVDVESVLFTGPILLVVGLLSVMAGLLAKYGRAAAVGACYAGVSLFFFLLVVIFDWGPGEAEQPFLWMGGAFNICIIPLFHSAWKIPPSPAPHECAHCGYFLYGLTEPRCPECGTPFPLEKLAMMKPPE